MSTMETFTFSLSESLAKRLEQMSTNHGPGFIDHLLESHMSQLDQSLSDPQSQQVTEWAPKIGLDSANKSVEIDVGSQVIVVNLSDFYKPRDAAELFGVNTAATDREMTNGGVGGSSSGLDLLASTANMYRSRGQTGSAGSPMMAAKKVNPNKFVCVICQTRCVSQMALRVHYGSAHGAQLHQCQRCDQSFIRRRDLEKHDCDADEANVTTAASDHHHLSQQHRVPPLVVRPNKGKRLEDTSSEEEDNCRQSSAASVDQHHHQYQQQQQQPVHRQQLGVSAAGAVAGSGRRASMSATSRGPSKPPTAANRKRLSESGKKEAYVCRVCQSKFRDPQSVLNHLKQFHPEHAMKAWKKFQDNLKSRRPDAPGGGRHASGLPAATGGVPGAAAGGTSAGADISPDTFAVRSVTGAPMKLKLSRSQQQQQQQQKEQQQEQQQQQMASVDGGDQYAVLPSEVPSLQPGQRQPIYHQTQYQVYQPEERPRAPAPSPPPAGATGRGAGGPGYVTCGVCSGTKYYTNSAHCRLYGSYACEPCRKFVSRASPDQRLACARGGGGGQCHIPVLAPRNATDTRCRACWLHKCLLAFNLPEQLHDGLRQTLPPSLRQMVPRSAVKPYKECGVCERDNME